MNSVLDTIRKRRSTRKYRSEQLRQEDLDQIMEAAIQAPSGHNDQAWHFTVVQNADLIREMTEATRKHMMSAEPEWIRKMGERPDFDVFYGAPTVVVVSGRLDGVSWQADCAAAIQNMLLAAESLQVGSVWLGLPRFGMHEKAVVERLAIPEGHQYYYTVALGYKADERERPGPARREGVIRYIR